MSRAVVFLLLVCGLFVAGAALAQTGHEPAGSSPVDDELQQAEVQPEVEHAATALGEDEEHPGGLFGLPQWVFLAINLILFLIILGYFGGPAVVRFLEGKGEALQTSLADARRQREEVATMAARLEAQIAELQREVDELRDRAETEGRRDREAIVAEAEQERERVKQQARDEISRRVQQGRQELTQHAVALAARLAEEKIASGITPEDRRRLFDRNLSRLEAK